MSEKANVFFIMPFSDEFFESYQMLKERFQDNYEFSHAGEEDNQQNILADIIPPIFNADIVIADLTGLNPNVMYELGIAHSLGKKTIIITRDDLGKLPFDLKQYRAKDYSTHFVKFDKLIRYLEKNMTGAIDGSVLFSNPVSDFLDKNNTSALALSSSPSINKIELESDKGFLDFLSEIEADTGEMNTAITDLVADMQSMREGTVACTSEIDRVKKTGGNSTATFVHKQAKKVANYISTFSNQLKKHNSDISSLWGKIERNIIGLIDNDFATLPENLPALLEYIKTLLGLKVATRNAHDGMESMKGSLQKIVGIERSLNQAIRFLENDLTDFLSVADQICASIDRIQAKSRYLKA